ncbi:MAG: hypothetical protein J7603_10355 [Pseudacidovorax sp.]|nr:hypothetical protein [Pseudacidovorax sp.]
MSFTPRLIHIAEPELQFAFGQAMAHPKDGLSLYGPLRGALTNGRLRIGVVATERGRRIYGRFAERLGKPIAPAKPNDPNHTLFPGFQAIFNVEWPLQPAAYLQIDPADLDTAISISDRHQAIHKAVSLYSDAIVQHLRDDAESHIDLWMAIVPEDVHKYCRPQSKSKKGGPDRVASGAVMDKKQATRLLTNEPGLFEEDAKSAEIYLYELDFHNQLKARLLEQKAAVQVLRETTMAPEEFLNKIGKLLRALQDPATLAWNLATTCYFKAGGKPWQLASVRPGVCYVGVVFKEDASNPEPGMVCCGAQMFLESGDGVVFKGTPGQFRSEKEDEFHLPRDKAKALMSLVVDAYRKSHGGEAPRELFIHGKTRFSYDEWMGFCETVPAATNVVCVRIREDSGVKLFRHGPNAIARGMAWIKSETRGYLWTKGYVTRLQTYAGREVPSPLTIEIARGNADIEQVMADVLGLTKLNYNACIYGDGVPVTLRFADTVGEILTAAPRREDLPPLPFRYYI